MGRRNIESLRAIDAAWNRRQWADYAALLDDGLVAWMSGDDETHGKAEHVLRAQQFCAMFPDCRVEDQYIDVFMSVDGQKTCSVAVLNGTSPSNGQRFSVTFAVICRWRDNRIVEQREYIDRGLFERQLNLPTEMNGDRS